MEQHRKRPLWRLLFGRTGVVFLLIILQILFLWAGIRWLQDLFPQFFAFSSLASLVFILIVVNSRMNPSFKLA